MLHIKPHKWHCQGQKIAMGNHQVVNYILIANTVVSSCDLGR